MRSKSTVSFAWATSALIAARSEAQRFARSAFDIHCEIALLKSPRRKKAGNIDGKKGVIVPLAGCPASYRITTSDPMGFRSRADFAGSAIYPNLKAFLDLDGCARRYFRIDVTLIRDHDGAAGPRVLRLDEAARLRCVPDARLGPQAREADSRAWGSAYP
jgi:hypothetical protein